MSMDWKDGRLRILVLAERVPWVRAFRGGLVSAEWCAIIR